MKPEPRKETNYRQWAFRVFLYVVVVNLVIVYRVMTFAVGFHDMEKFQQNIAIVSIFGNLLLITGIILTILSIKNDEKKNYQYYISIIGYPFFLILTFISLAF
ncbi:hypothetical protein [Mangrovimonas sp. YM274]|uniref:hypothetical protein n=1 Tax=Mangrovimonas sp. YM274 TaxID=3070660 RepID=UPI0027DC739D|nr:hypothetical protein [Mangrovimonas sp. YM274]WMI69193.1 hypothetical protein RBH95_02190 [Mangrovimonas sp. YM274]